MDTTVVSAPGKVLLAGGYLVLDPKYAGLVVSTSSRFYTIVRAGTGNPNEIHVSSPQFKSAIWNYSVDVSGSRVGVTDNQSGSECVLSQRRRTAMSGASIADELVHSEVALETSSSMWPCNARCR